MRKLVVSPERGFDPLSPAAVQVVHGIGLAELLRMLRRHFIRLRQLLRTVFNARFVVPVFLVIVIVFLFNLWHLMRAFNIRLTFSLGNITLFAFGLAFPCQALALRVNSFRFCLSFCLSVECGVFHL